MRPQSPRRHLGEPRRHPRALHAPERLLGSLRGVFRERDGLFWSQVVRDALSKSVDGPAQSGGAINVRN